MLGLNNLLTGRTANGIYMVCFGMLIMVFLTACQNNVESIEGELSTDIVNNPITANSEESGEVPAMDFENTELDFGKIIQGEKISHTFSFTNTGESPLVISDVSATCGCTVPTWPKAPVLPGEKGEISVVFDSNGRSGSQMKQVTVITNAVPSTKVLKLIGEVMVPTSN